MNDLTILREKVKALSILIVDDEEAVLDGSVTFMKKFFKNVESANNAPAALQKFSGHDGYDIVMTDIKMPGMSGWELIKKLREMDDKLFIAAITGSPEKTHVQLSQCDVYLKKPVSIDEMIDMLNKIIHKYEL